MSKISQKYKTFIKTREINYIFLVAVCLLIQTSSFPAMLDTSLEQIGRTVVVHVFLSVLPEEEVSGIQLEYAYDIQNWEFVSAFPGETLLISNKQLQVVSVYGRLRVLIIGFNNYPIPSGELFALQFNALTEGANRLGFNITQVKLSSPEAQTVPFTIINNRETTELPADNNLEREIPPSDTDNNSTTSTETGTNPQTEIKSPTITTNITNIKPDIQEVADIETTPTYFQTPSTKSSHPISSSGFGTNMDSPYIHDGKTYSHNKKMEHNTVAPKPMPVPEKNIFRGKQYLPENKTILIGKNTGTQNGSSKPTSTVKSTRTPASVFTKTVEKSSSPIMNVTTENNSNGSIVSSDNTNKPLQNPYFALNISNISPNRGRSNECAIIDTNISKDIILENGNSLIIFISIIVILLMALTTLSAIIKKQRFFYRKK